MVNYVNPSVPLTPFSPKSGAWTEFQYASEIFSLQAVVQLLQYVEND